MTGEVGSTSTGTGNSGAAGSTTPSTSTSAGSGAGSSGSGGTGAATPAAATTSSSPKSEGSALESLQRVAASSAAATGEQPASAQGNQPAGNQPAGAVTQPAAGGTEQPKPYSPPPVDKWPEVLGRARTQAQQQFLESLGVRERADLERALHWHRQLNSDPRAFARQLLAEIDEQGGMGNEEVEEQLVDPKPSLRSPDGKQVYTAEEHAQSLQNLEKRLLKQLRGELAPVLQFTKEGQETAERARITEEGRAIAKDLLSQVSALPHFEEIKKDVAEVLASMDVNVRRRMGSGAALYAAYNKVLAEKILPTYDQRAQERVTADMRRKAATSTGGVVPAAGAAPAKPVLRDGDVDGLARRMQELAAQ